MKYATYSWTSVNGRINGAEYVVFPRAQAQRRRFFVSYPFACANGKFQLLRCAAGACLRPLSVVATGSEPVLSYWNMDWPYRKNRYAIAVTRKRAFSGVAILQIGAWRPDLVRMERRKTAYSRCCEAVFTLPRFSFTGRKIGADGNRRPACQFRLQRAEFFANLLQRS